MKNIIIEYSHISSKLHFIIFETDYISIIYDLIVYITVLD